MMDMVLNRKQDFYGYMFAGIHMLVFINLAVEFLFLNSH